MHCQLTVPEPADRAAATPLVALLMPCAQATVLGTTLLAMIPPTAVGMLQHHRYAVVGNVWLFGVGVGVACLACACGPTTMK